MEYDINKRCLRCGMELGSYMIDPADLKPYSYYCLECDRKMCSSLNSSYYVCPLIDGWPKDWRGKEIKPGVTVKNLNTSEKFFVQGIVVRSNGFLDIISDKNVTVAISNLEVLE